MTGPLTSHDVSIAGLPKAELHVHHVGSASPRIVADLAARHPGTMPADLDELAAFYTFRDFAHFIDVYLAVVDLVRTPDDVHHLTYEVTRELAVQNVRYAEMTLTPYTSVLAGIPIQAFVESAEATLGYALDHGPATLVGLGLGGPEIGVGARPVPVGLRPGPGRGAPQRAARRGDDRTRDDLGGPRAARCGADRSPHQGGPRRAAARTLGGGGHTAGGLPTSNVATRAVASLDEHPIRAMRDAGVVVTVNSDDPPMFGTTPQQGVRRRCGPARARRGGAA
jgi:aminodeoxyfutalosine deaminase